MRDVRLGWAGVLLMGTLACGGGETANEEEDTSGDETLEEEDVPMDEDCCEDEFEDGTESAEEEVATPTGPGQLTVHNRAGTDNVGGTVQVLSLEGEVVAEGNSGETFEVPSGEYQLAGTVDESVIAGGATNQNEDTTVVQPGRTAEVYVRHPRAMVRFRVRRGNRAISQWRLEVTRQGQTLTLRPNGDEYLPVPPGRYNGVLHFGASQITVNDLIFQDGARRDLPINVN